MSRLERIKSMPCACCGWLPPSQAHHIREGQGMGQRASDYLAIPLCWECHQGRHGVHGDRSRMRNRQTDEIRMLGETLERLHRDQEPHLRSVREVGNDRPIQDRGQEDAGGVVLPGAQAGGAEAAGEILYVGPAMLRESKHDWARFTLDPDAKNPFLTLPRDGSYMLAVVRVPE